MKKKYFIRTLLVFVLFFVFFLTCPPLSMAGGDHAHEDGPAPRMSGGQHEMEKIKNWVKIFEDPERDEWQEPGKVIETMRLKKGDMVADIGAGTGYFTRRIARAVGSQGVAFGVDIEPRLLHYMEKDTKKLNLKNYKPVLATMDDSTLSPMSVDVVFFCLTLHHVYNRVPYLKKLKKVFKNGGRVVVVEFYKRKMDFGPPSNHKMSREETIEEFTQAGYRLTRSLDFLQYQYFLEFEPVS